MQIQLKPGKTITEFRGTIIGAILLLVLTVLDQIDGEYAAGGAAILAVFYQRQRANLKKIQAQAEADVLKDTPPPADEEPPADAAQ